MGLVFLPVVGAVRAEGMPLDSVRKVLRTGYAEALRQPVVTVTLRFRVSIHEAVTSPGLYWAEPTWSPLDLVSEAGGFMANAKEDQLRLIRNGNVFAFNAKSYLETGEGSIAAPLQSGDRIVVPRRRGILTLQNFQFLLSTTSLVLAIINLAR